MGLSRCSFTCLTSSITSERIEMLYSNECQSKATRMRRTSSGHNISLHPGQNQPLLKIPKSESSDFSIRPLKHKWPKSWSSVEDPIVPLERTLYGHPLAGTLWDRQFEKILWKYGWEEGPGWEYFFVAEKKDYSCLCIWTVFNWLGRNKSLTQCGKNL